METSFKFLLLAQLVPRKGAAEQVLCSIAMVATLEATQPSNNSYFLEERNTDAALY